MPAKIAPGNNCTNCTKRKRCPDFINHEGCWCGAYRKDASVMKAEAGCA